MIKGKLPIPPFAGKISVNRIPLFINSFNEIPLFIELYMLLKLTGIECIFVDNAQYSQSSKLGSVFRNDSARCTHYMISNKIN